MPRDDAPAPDRTARRRLRLRGVVQGVGFRPHVHRVALAHGIAGSVLNDGDGVVVDAQAAPEALDAFVSELLGGLPRLARVLDVASEELPPRPDAAGFAIVASAPARESSSRATAIVPPDVAICPACRAEMADPADRRHRYPFITCVDCGPRLSIIEDLPYDRPRTTMRDFRMCPACRAEYDDPADRRHHAQPVSCPDCGPRLWLERTGAGRDDAPRDGAAGDSGDPVSRPSRDFEPVLAAARAVLDAGGILAVKGIGGFHLMCDAGDAEAVAKLRARKNRPHKPFAVMVPDAAAARRVVELDDAEAAELESPAAPIVIAPERPGSGLAPEVAPGLGDVGVMVAYSPLHVLLVDRPMVATSGNPPGEPLCHRDDDARRHLAHLADALLLHDRGIHVPVEDSVQRGLRPIRRSRGHAPLPVILRAPSPRPDRVALAVGGELKNTFALLDGDAAHVSPHVGDMGSWEVQRRFAETAERLMRFRGLEPELIVHDLHPGYAATAWAQRFAADRGLPLLGVQHHHSHALSLLAEHGAVGRPAVVAAADGTGYGADGAIWGGEVLALGADPMDWSRAWHLPEFPLAGGDRSVRRPWRLAAGLAHGWEVPEVAALLRPPAPSRDDAPIGPAAEARLLASQLESGAGVARTTSLGRLFDAASALLRPPARRFEPVTYEGQAAMELEHLAAMALRAGDALPETPGTPRGLVRMLADGAFSPGARAAAFHDGVARLFAGAMAEAAEATGAEVLGFTGGCALNVLLERRLTQRLAADGRTAGLPLLLHRIVPAGDGGLCLGQALAARLAE
ncbi:carbamoyltransferase HypF [Corynebacterium sp. 335C]